VQPLFKIKLLKKDGAFVEYWLALVLSTIPESSCNLDSVMTFVQQRKPLVAVASQGFCLENIIGCAHMILKIATSSKTGEVLNE